MKMNDEQGKFVLEMARTGVRPELIASALSRRYKATFTAIQVQQLLGVNKDQVEIQQQRDEVAKQLGSHDGEMRYLRDKLREIFDNPMTGNREKIEVAKEIRQNIGALQKMASMKDDRGEFHVVLMINDSSMDDKVIDMEAT